MPMKFLAVDDEDIVRTVLVRMLEKAEPGCIIKQFGKAKDALAAVQKGFVPDIAFLDIEMYGMTGLELAKEIQQVCSRTEIVFVTGYSQYTIDAFALHAHGYLLKPFSQKQIQDEIQSIKEKSAIPFTVKEMFEKFSASKDTALQKKLAACKTSEEAYNTAKQAGLQATKDEFVFSMVEYCKSQRNLSDSELDNVAGGLMNDCLLENMIREMRKK
jgi:predicted ribosomally synthesized peptide with nif11-like leader